jgi:hypothetical protein
MDDVFLMIEPEQAQELRRLCGLYDEAKSRGDIDQARGVRAGISDYLKSIALDSEVESDLRRQLGFPVEPSPLTNDQ